MLFVQQGEFRFNIIERASTVGTEDCLEGDCVCFVAPAVDRVSEWIGIK